MKVKEIVKQWLTEKGYEGLCDEDCGCEIKDLMPCDAPRIDCIAGYKVPCPGEEDCEAGGGCPWHISPNKQVQKGGE